MRKATQTAARTRLPAAERERQILRAATEVFAGSNYRLAGTARIARAAGISEPTIYKYFTSKKDLFLRILERIGRRIVERWQQEVAAEPGDAITRLERAGAIYFAGLRDHASETKIQFQALAESDDPEIAQQLRENHEQYVRFFVQLVERGQHEGVIRADVDPQVAGWALDGIGFTATMIQLLHFAPDKADERIAAMLIDASIAWLRSEPATSAPRAASHGEASRKNRTRRQVKEK